MGFVNILTSASSKTVFTLHLIVVTPTLPLTSDEHLDASN